MRWRKTKKGEPSRWKLLLWTAVASLVFGLIGLGELPEDALRTARNKLHVHKASGDIVFVAIDDRSLREVGRWPWSRRHYAQMIDRLSEAGAKRTVLDIIIQGRSTPADDALFIQAIDKARNVTLPMAPRGTTGFGDTELLPPAVTGKHAELGLIDLQYNYQNAVWRLNFS